MNDHQTIVDEQTLARDNYTSEVVAVQINNSGEFEYIVQDRNGEYHPQYDTTIRDLSLLEDDLPF